MEYCFGPGDGTAAVWTGVPDVDLDGDGAFDGIGLDFDGDDARDDALVDLDDDGTADHAVLDFDDDGVAETSFTDDGSGTWAVPATRLAAAPGEQLRWFTLDGLEQHGGPLVDFDADGADDDTLRDTDGDGTADRVLPGGGAGPAVGYVDIDGDGSWDLRLTDTDGDGAADAATQL